MPGRAQKSPKHKAKNIKQKLVFNARKDILLLKTVVQHEVWISNNWTIVAQDLTGQGLQVTRKCVKDRCLLLMKGFRSLTLSTMRSSGTEEEFDERSSLLADLVGFWDAEQLIKTHGPENDEVDPLNDDIFEESEILDVISTEPTASSSTLITHQPQHQVPAKRARLEEKRLADRERDTARDLGVVNSTKEKTAVPDRLKTKKQAHLDLVEEKILFDLECRRRELKMRESEQVHKFDLEKREMKIKEELQRQEFEVKQKELLLEDRRLSLQLESNTNNPLMLKLLESALKNK